MVMFMRCNCSQQDELSQIEFDTSFFPGDDDDAIILFYCTWNGTRLEASSLSSDVFTCVIIYQIVDMFCSTIRRCGLSNFKWVQL